MASVFSGMGRILSTVLGDGVTYTPAGGAPRVIQSIFRETPTEALDDDMRPVLIVAPTWRVQRDLVPDLARGDRIAPGNGKLYAILSDHPSGSPAEDAFVICALERVFS